MRIALALAVLGLCFFGDCAATKSGGILGPALAEVTAALRDAWTQWMVFGCAAIYLLAFAVLRMRLDGAAGNGVRVDESGGWRFADRSSNVRTGWSLAAQWLRKPAFWMTGLLVLAGVAYACDYSQAVKSTQALTLLGAAVLGQGAGLWESSKQKAVSRNGGTGTVVSALIVLLLGAAVWQGETRHIFQYRCQVRLSGPWDHPNMFGVLMGVGVVLTLGSLKSKVQSLKSKVQSTATSEGRREHRALNWRLWLKRAFFLTAAGVTGVGLLRSYSRGAWLGATVGVAYLIAKAESREQKAGVPNGRGLLRWAGRQWVALAIIGASVGLLGFWICPHTEGAVLRRAYSAANANDFSWRNRVAAYEGALQMLANKPWFGFGWNQPERVYERYYRAARVDEGMAIQVNDYLMLGTTLGIPGLLCFAMYVGLSLRSKSKVQCPMSETTLDFRLWTLDFPTVCRAGAVVLLVGFWFDGGLFRLATGATFWVLLELGGQEPQPVWRV